jgi:nucleoside-diphosphate-sugar epimerase
MPRYLVTGGAGFIGSSIADALLSSGESVRVVDDFSSGRRVNVAAFPERFGSKFELVEGTIVDPAVVARAVEGVDLVFHEAAIPSVARSVENPVATMLAGTQATTVLLDAARHAGVRRVVFAASSSAYGDTPTLPKIETMRPQPLSPYALSKLACEELMRIFASLYGIETVSLRYFNVFGPRQDPASEYAAVIPKFITAALRGTRPIVFGDGEQTRDFCFIDNTVHANLLAASSSSKLKGEVVNVACGTRISLNQLLAMIHEIAVARGVRPADAKLAPEYRESRAGDVRDSLADITAASKLLAYAPKVEVREGLERTFDAMRAAG